MTDSARSDTGTVQTWIDGLDAIVSILMFVTAIVVGLVGAYFGYWWSLLLIPAGWLITALDPKIGRWKHVWE